VNDIGENFWGAKRSKAPEEFELGAPIDAKTNVFTMGAIAFGLLGGEMDHSYSKWEAGKRLYEVALLFLLQPSARNLPELPVRGLTNIMSISR
jgi:serine/threonine-protein kinase